MSAQLHHLPLDLSLGAKGSAAYGGTTVRGAPGTGRRLALCVFLLCYLLVCLLLVLPRGYLTEPAALGVVSDATARGVVVVTR